MPAFAPPKGRLRNENLSVISAASARTSSNVTPSPIRTPPVACPYPRLSITNHPRLFPFRSISFTSIGPSTFLYHLKLSSSVFSIPFPTVGPSLLNSPSFPNGKWGRLRESLLLVYEARLLTRQLITLNPLD